MKDKYIDAYGIDSLKQLSIASRTEAEIFVTNNIEMLIDRDELEEKYQIKIKAPNEL